MENIKTPVEDIIDDLKDYVDTSFELYKLKATGKAAEMVSGTIINLTIAFTAGFALLFISLAAAFMISEFLANTYVGFVIVGGVYAFTCIVIYLTKDKWLKNRLINSFIQAIYSGK